MEGGKDLLALSDSRWERAPYETVAAIYDELMGHFFQARQKPLLESSLEEFGLTGGAWADVACGTGTLACHLAEQGWRVHGSDVSESMLAVAREKAARHAGDVTFHRQDMRRLSTPAPCDAVSCFFDSINILTRKSDVVQAFRAAARALKPGGYYFLDAVTPWHTSHLWDCCDQTHEGEGFFGAWEIRSLSPSHVLTVTMHWFLRQGNGLFSRADETHRIRGYTRRDVKEALKAAGLRLVTAYDGDEGFLAPPHRHSMRIDYVARKPLE